MIRILRNILVSLLGLTSFFLSLEAYAQDEKCAGTPVKEAVRNGDFEAGYLPGPDQGVTTASHTFTPGDQFDFESDLQYAGKWHGAKGFCDWGMANQYGVGRVEKMTNPGCAGNQIVYGMYANAATYKDHTTGTDKGFSLIVDFDGKSGFKTVWAQNVDVYSSQKYYFSAWFALYAGSATPTLRFRVESYDAGGTLIEQKTLGSAPIAPPIMQWQQFNGVYDTPSNAKTAKIFIECEPAGGTGNDDFIIDDISFINGCQKIKTFVSYEAEFDEEEVSLCYNNNAYTAQVKKDNGTNLGPTGKTITWFKGDGASQTEVAAFANQDAPNITEPGTYRACIVDIANNGCTVNASLVVTEDLEVTLPAADLCDPAEVTLNTNRTEAGLVHNWTVPAGATKSTTNEQLANVGGDYTANVSLPSNPNCKASGTSKVTSSLPVPPTNLTYCDGGGEKSTLAYQNTKWKWCEDKDCNTVIGEGTSVDWTPAAGTTGDQTLYMQNATTSNISGGSIGNNTGTTDIAAGSYTNITVLQTVLLASVKATIPSWLTGAQNRNVEIKNLTTGDSKTYGPFNIKSNSVANVNAVLPAGKYRIFIRGGGAQTAPDWTGNGPALYSVKDYVNITGYSGNGKTHGPFKQLTFKKTEACAPVAVTIKAEQCCLTPKSVTVTATKEELCTGDQSNLSVDVQYESGTTATNFIAFWVKDGTTDPLNATKISNLTGLTSADAGDYTHVVIDKDKATNIGCAKVSTVTLTALPAPTTADAGDDVTDLCTEEYDLQGNSLATGETGKWTVKSGSGNFADDTNPTTKVTGLGFGDNVFVWTITNSCGETKDEVKITRLEPIAGGSLTQPTGNVCADSTGLVFEVTGITGTNPVYDWTMPTGVTQNGSGASIKLNVGSNVASGTSGDVKVSISGDCPGTVDLSATLNWDNVPDVSNASITAIDPVCVNNTGQQTLELTGFVGTVDSYGWSATDPANPTNLIFLTGTSNPLNAQLTQQITFGATEASKTITIRVQAQNKCGDSDVVEGSAKIDNLPTESKIAFTDAKLCIKDPIFLSGNTPVIGTGKWVTAGSTTGGTVKDENDGGSELTNLQGGQKYEGKWVISNGVCPAS
ncbi:MAG: hypothetical protein GY827_01615, partial [Cytophagales bacterium]|nr:hypothetical protein [Cytophagales bacterium]